MLCTLAPATIALLPVEVVNNTGTPRDSNIGATVDPGRLYYMSMQEGTSRSTSR